MSLQKQWSEKTQWLVRHRISAISLEENQARGAKKDVSNVNGGDKDKKLGVKNGTEVELWAIFGRVAALLLVMQDQRQSHLMFLGKHIKTRHNAT
eukprot:1160373-Pelagomonas_calceolata.AAC.8